jgi:lysophospholipase L1-like esterase
MRLRSLWFALSFILSTASGAFAAGRPYILALGDSLSIGIQPDGSGNYVATNQGYADDLYAFYHAQFPALRLAKLGCSGETTGSMRTGIGSPCSYDAGNQLAEAVAFLGTHDVALITLDIGADNLLQCFDRTTLTIDSTCIAAAGASAPGDLVTILATLHAASPDTLIVGMNYYNPFLAAWIFGPAGQALAAKSVPLINGFNAALDAVYHGLYVPVADVAGTFRTNQFPANVVLALTWTWMAAPPPRGPDVHPNALGYLAIASAFAKAITIAAP